VLSGNVAGVPVSFLIFLLAAIAGQILLVRTAFGRQLVMIGSNRRAAEAAGVPVARVTTAAFAVAGLYCGLAGILLGARYGSGDMQAGAGFEYQAIAAVLVGGVAIEGGRGSVINAALGVLAIATMNAVALLQGFSMEGQYLFVGLAVSGVVILQGFNRLRQR
jgi:ribose/xylose/arabinose/galactoside ABC-type transport system permease subunit